MLLRYNVLVWQSFIRTSHLLSSKLAGVVLYKPFAVVHIARDSLGQVTLDWQNPARTYQLLETDMVSGTGSGLPFFTPDHCLKWAQCPMSWQRLNPGLTYKQKEKRLSLCPECNAFYTQRSSCDLEIPIVFRCFN